MNNDQPRRPLTAINAWGITVLHPLRPYIAAWWSAAYPGFGLYLLNQNLRGTFLTLLEVFINTLGHINEAIIYTICGNFDLARAILNPGWAIGYAIVYYYSIWSSYNSALTQNKLYQLTQLDNEPLKVTALSPLEYQYIEKKNPLTPAFYSCMFPGLGQLYNNQTGLALWAMLWWWIFIGLSHVYEAVFYLSLGDIAKSTAVLVPHWLLFMPSIWGGSVYYAYLTALEHNRLFRREQRKYFAERYRDCAVRIFS